MSIQNSAQGSITIKRLRNGDSLFIAFENNGIALYQGVNPTSGAITPDWTVAANQPIITPKVTSARGNTVVRSQHQWRYNNQLLDFSDGSHDSNNWRTDGTVGKFQLNLQTGALKIIGNLANVNAVANAQLSYTCVATVSGTNYNLSKSIDVVIQNIGSSAYYGTLLATSGIISSSESATTLNTALYAGAQAVESYYVKWYKDNELWADKNGQKSIEVTRADVDGTQLFIAEFYQKEGDATHVARAGVYIIDADDEFAINFKYDGSNREVAIGQSVTVVAQVVNMRTNQVVTLPSGAVWRCDVMNKDTWEVIKTSQTNTIEVTTAETDKDGRENDVEVVAEVSWS